MTLTRKGRLAIVTQAAWGTAESSFASTDYLECNGPITPPLAREAIKADTYKPGLGSSSEVLPGSKTPTDFPISGDLHGWSSATPSADPTAHPDALVLSRALGGIAAGDGYTTALAAGASTTAFKYTNGSGDTAWAGYAQNVPISGGRAIGWLGTIDNSGDPDSATLAAAITAAHSSSGTMYGSRVCYNAPTTYAPTAPLTMQWLGTEAEDQIRYFDAAVRSYTLTLQNKLAPAFSAVIAAIDWTPVGSGGAPSDYAYTYPKIPVWTGANGARAYLAGTARCYHKVVITITNTLEAGDCHSSTQGVSQWYYGDRDITIETHRLLTNTGLVTGAPGDQPGLLQIDLATTPGRSASVLAYVQIEEQPTLVAVGNLIHERVLYRVIPFTADGSSTAPADTNFRVAFM